MNELITILIAASPILELRASIPIALGIFHFSFTKAITLSIIGNILPIIPAFFLLGPITDYVGKKIAFFESFMNWIFTQTRKNHSKRIEILGAIGLVLLTAIPVPLTGAWTAVIAAFLFDIPFKKALPAILFGVIIAAFIVAGLVGGLIYFL